MRRIPRGIHLYFLVSFLNLENKDTFMGLSPFVISYSALPFHSSQPSELMIANLILMSQFIPKTSSETPYLNTFLSSLIVSICSCLHWVYGNQILYVHYLISHREGEKVSHVGLPKSSLCHLVTNFPQMGTLMEPGCTWFSN